MKRKIVYGLILFFVLAVFLWGFDNLKYEGNEYRLGRAIIVEDSVPISPPCHSTEVFGRVIFSSC